MTFLALTIGWLGEVAAGLLFTLMFLVLARAFVQYFYHGGTRAGWALREMTDPILHPFRRLTAPLRLRFDLAPLVAAVVLYVAQALVYNGAQLLAWQVGGAWAHSPGSAVFAVVEAVRWLVWAYMFLVLLRVLVTWFGGNEYHPFMRRIARLVDPALRTVRRVVGRSRGRIDWAPFILLAGLWFIDRVVLEAALLTW